MGLITIYSIPNCGYCMKAKSVAIELDNHNKNLVDCNDPDADISRVKHSHTFPQIWVDDTFLGGYTEFAQWIQDESL